MGRGLGVGLPFMAANTDPRPGKASVSCGWVVLSPRRAAKVTASTAAAVAMLRTALSTGRRRTGSVSGRLSRVFWVRRCRRRGTSATPYSSASAALKALSLPMGTRGLGSLGSRSGGLRLGSFGSGFFICFISATVNPPPLWR